MASVPLLQKKARCRPLISTEPFGQRALILVVVEIGAVDQQGSLLANHLNDAGVGMTQSVDTDSGEEIEIPLALKVVEVAAFSTGKRQRIPGVVLEQVLPLQIHQCLGRGVHGWW